MMNDLVFLAAHQLAKAIRDREVSSTEVMEAHLSQADGEHPVACKFVVRAEKPASVTQGSKMLPLLVKELNPRGISKAFLN